jgi:ABC transport system ATP-binding/permease protein
VLLKLILQLALTTQADCMVSRKGQPRLSDLGDSGEPVCYIASPVSLLSARALTKSYGPQTIFHDIALTIEEGDRVGLLGINGSGKSTLLKILSGVEPFDTGVIDRRRGARLAYLPQEPELRADVDAREIVSEGLVDWRAATARHAEVSRLIARGKHDAGLLLEQAQLSETVLHLGGWRRDHVAEEYLMKLGILEMTQPVGTMSGGERRRVALARLLVSEPDLVILDEPTNHLDTDTIEWLEGILVAMNRAVLLVTHDRYVLDAIATRMFEIDNGALREFRGNYGDYLVAKAALLEQEGRVESNRQNLLRREQAWLQRGPKARTTKQKARIQRAEAIFAVQAPREAASVKLETIAARTGKTIIEFHDVGLDLGGRTLIDGLRLHLVQGDRIGIIGPNGAGKTSLLKLAIGDLTPSRGAVVRGVQTKIAYFDQARAGLRDEWSIFDNVAGREGAERTGGGVVQLGERTLDLRTYLDQFLFEPSKQRQKVGSLSGGERARVGLAKMLKTGANLLLFDEPTNDLDIGTLAALEEMLTSWAGCALVVTHDRYFLNRVATSVLAFERGKSSVVHYPGGYDNYRAARDEQVATTKRAESALPAAAASPKSSVRPTRMIKPLTYAERIELDKILDVVSEVEAELAAVEERLADPALYASNSGDAKRLDLARRRLSTRIEELTQRWEELEARRDTKK